MTLALADALGVEEQPDEPLVRSVEGRLHGRQILLILDNCESVPDVAPLVADLIDRCPQVKVLATSRDLLHVRAEHEYRLAPLAHEDAATLFNARAAAARPGIDLGARIWTSSRQSAGGSTACRSRSSSPLRAFGCCRSPGSSTGSKNASRSWSVAHATCRSGSERSPRRSSGATCRSRARSKSCCSPSPCSPAAPRSRRPSAGPPAATRSSC